ncbi:serine hydrolase-like protein [Leptotrombidium deliense]|uniref:Serine hydrolase-like protein n=1 Tax=Leptotrombidium deliense TaxID=299467 RepID=A0A443SCZ5_9ACAR|nr:serine hydrolase-like protein [Leptotrombidium deliense]
MTFYRQSIRSTLLLNLLYLNRTKLRHCHSVISKEIKIPTPYGHIAAKEFGDRSGHQILAIHGFMDNCATFDTLIPNIIDKMNVHVIAMDEPGGGHSSKLPIGADLSQFTIIKEMKRVVNHLKWTNFSIIGHSYGAFNSILFASIYPRLVQSVVALDTYGSRLCREYSPLKRPMAKTIDMILDFEQKVMNKANADSYEKVYHNEHEAIERVMNAGSLRMFDYSHRIPEKAATLYVKRGMKSYNNGLIFTRDYRHKMPMLGLIPVKNDYLEKLKSIRCDLLLVMADDGLFKDYEGREQWFNIYEKQCRYFKEIVLKGQHYIHIDEEDLVGTHISNFIKESLSRGLHDEYN